MQLLAGRDHGLPENARILFGMAWLRRVIRRLDRDLGTRMQPALTVEHQRAHALGADINGQQSVAIAHTGACTRCQWAR